MEQSHVGLCAQTKVYSLSRRGNAAILLWALLTLIYLWVRVPLWNPQAPILSTLLLSAELFGIGSLSLHIFCAWKLVDRRPPSPPLGMTADIFVTTWNEPVEMLRNTLLAAKAVRHAGTIWLLDDGSRSEMKGLADEIGVAYLSRTDRSHAKAGNLNNALGHSTADYIAVFDCDHAPSPDFLERTLGYFTDPAIAFVQTPQDFYNIDSFQHRGSRENNEVWHEQTLFYRVIQPGKDRLNGAFFCGSCAIVRRKALDEIDGFATGTITEDLHTSLKMHKRGWTSAYHAEALAFGLSPSDFDQYQTQRLRWARGAMQVWTKEGFLFTPGLTLAQRLSYLASTATYFEGWQKAIVYFMPIVVILTGWMPIGTVGPTFLALFTAWLLSGMVVNEIVSRGYAKTLWMEEYNLFRYFTFIRATLALVIPVNWRFVVTPKGRAAAQRPFISLLPQILLAAGAAAALIVGTYIYVTTGHLPATAFTIAVVFLLFDLILSGRALTFAWRHLHQRRGSHRFPLPLPVSIDRRGWNGPTVAEDVSSDGMLLQARTRGAIRNLRGTLHLPNCDLPFKGRVVRRFEDGKFGIEFEWATPGDADPLNACLYGNTLQWDINALTETRRGGPSAPTAGRSMDEAGWQIGRICCQGHKPINCVARLEDGDKAIWRVVSYRRPQAGEGVKVMTEVATGADLRVAACSRFTVGTGKVYVSVLAADPNHACAGSHRKPRWSNKPGKLSTVDQSAIAAE